MAKKRPARRDLESRAREPNAELEAWATSTRSQTRRAGWGRPPPTVNLAACIAETGRQTLVVDLDPQCNATVDARPRPRGAPVLLRHASAATSRSPRRRGRPPPTTSGSFPPTAISPAPRSSCPASTAPSTGSATSLGPVRERFAATFLDCPPSLGPITVNALAAADRVDRAGPGRVPRARGARPVPRHAPDRCAVSSTPALVLTGIADHHG